MIKLSLIVHIFLTADLRKGFDLISVQMWLHFLSKQLKIVDSIFFIKLTILNLYYIKIEQIKFFFLFKINF